MTNQPAPASVDRAPALLRVPRWWIVASLALLVVKLVLVSHNEIEIRSADDSGYAVCASEMYWGAPYQPYSYSRQPGYPLFIVLAQVLGVPMRVLIELVWCGASAGFAIALRRAGFSAAGSFSVYALALFSPISFWMFNRLLPDGVYAACMLAMLGGVIGALLVPRPASAWRWGALGAAGAAVAANTRQETPLIFGILVVAGVLAVLFARRQRAQNPEGPKLWTRVGAAVLLPLVATLALTNAFCFVNKQRVGLYVTYDLVAPGVKALYRELISIPPQTPRIDLPVPRDVRDIAYANSPAFARLKPFLDGEADPQNPYKAACKQFSGVDGEFGAWTIWGLRRAAWQMNAYKWSSGAELDAFFAQAARELADARARGVIGHRRVLNEYLPPEYGELWSRLPTSIGRCWSQVSHISAPGFAPDQIDPQLVARINFSAVRRVPAAAVTDQVQTPMPTVWHGSPVAGVLAGAQRGIARVGEWVTVAGAIASGLLMVLAVPLLIRGKASLGAHALLVVSTLVLAAIVSRVLLFAVLDACGIFSQQRYMFIVGALLILTVPISIEALAHVLRPRAEAVRRPPG